MCRNTRETGNYGMIEYERTSFEYTDTRGTKTLSFYTKVFQHGDGTNHITNKIRVALPGKEVQYFEQTNIAEAFKLYNEF